MCICFSFMQQKGAIYFRDYGLFDHVKATSSILSVASVMTVTRSVISITQGKTWINFNELKYPFHWGTKCISETSLYI